MLGGGGKEAYLDSLLGIGNHPQPVQQLPDAVHHLARVDIQLLQKRAHQQANHLLRSLGRVHATQDVDGKLPPVLCRATLVVDR